MNIVTFLVILSLLILAHELGHFLVARFFKVRVKELAVGFPPRLLSFRKGETKYSLGLIPLGGFVQLLGEDEADETLKSNKKSFSNKPPWQRFLIVLSGVAFNFLLAWLIFSVAFAIGSRPIVSQAEDFSRRAVLERAIYLAPLAGQAAEKAGLEPGDRLVSLAGQTIERPEELKALGKSLEGEVSLVVERRGEEKVLILEPSWTETPLGVEIAEDLTVRLPPGEAILAGLRETGRVIGLTARAIFDFFGGLFSTRQTTGNVTGPVGIFFLTSAVASQGLKSLLPFVALLSVNLGIINLLPIPALDGGRALFISLERLLGRKIVRVQIEALIHNIGFFLLLLLILIVTYKDIVRLSF